MLKLIKLELEGFGCFKDFTEFNYESGVNLIKAQNGKGKTTSIEALEFMLLSNIDGNYADYLYRDKVTKVTADEFTISLEFMIDNYHLLETFNCKKGSKTCTSTRNLKDLESGNDLANGEGVKEWLNERLPVATSKYALFVRQFSEKDDIIKCQDSERRDLFKKIKDLDYSKEIETLIEPKVKQVKEKVVEVDKEIFALENKKYEIRDYLDLPFTEDEYNLKKNKLDKLNAEKALVEERKVRFDELTASKNKIANEITSVENVSVNKKISIADYNKFIENAESEKDKIITRCEISKVESSKKVTELNASIDNLDDEKNDKIKEINNNIASVEKEIESNKSELSNIKLVKLIKFDESPLINARNNLSELKTKSSIAQKNADTLKSGKCPLCGGDCKGQHENFENEAKSYDEQVIECQKTIDDLIQKKNNYEESSKKNQENKELKMNFESKISTLEEKLSTYKNSLNNLDTLYESKTNEIKSKIANEEQKYSNEEQKCTSDCKAIDDKVELYKKQKSEYESIIAENDKKVAELNTELEEINKKLSEYDDSNKTDFSEIDSLSTELKKYDDVISKNKVIKEYNEGIESAKKSDKVELDKLKEKKQKFEKEKFDLESSKKVMTTDYPNWCINNSIQNIEDDVNNFIQDVYYKELSVKFDSTKTGIKMTFGDNIPIKRLSGCESAITRIGFVNSFNKNLNCGLILLDEPDAPMSDSVKTEFYNSLLEMKNLFNQMIIVTHSEKMCNFIQANDTDCNIITL